MNRMSMGTLIASVALASSMLAMTGCVKQAEYDAKVAEIKKQGGKLESAEKEIAQLRKDIETAKAATTKAEIDLAQVRGDITKAAAAAEAKVKEAVAAAETKGKALADENAALKKEAEKVPQLEQKAAQLQKDLDAAKDVATKSAEAAKSLDAKIKALEQEVANMKKAAEK